MNEKPIYTFVIPAFNAEKTIKKAIDSISSNMENYEIIIAENGSKDNTTALVEQLMQNDTRIRLIHTEKGVSKARNAGIRDASGKWIAFLDADDEWGGNTETVNAEIQKAENADIVFFSYNKNNKIILMPQKNRITLTGKELELTKKQMISTPTLFLTVWAKMFKADFLKHNELFFNENLKVSEDSELMVRALKTCKSINISSEVVYRYCLGVGSTTRTVDIARSYAYLEALQVVKKDLTDSNDLLHESFYDYAIAQLNLITVHDIFNCKQNSTWKERIRHLKLILSDTTIQETIQTLTLKDVRKLHNLPAFLFSKQMYLFGGIICSIRSIYNNKLIYTEN